MTKEYDDLIELIKKNVYYYNKSYSLYFVNDNVR